MKLEVGMYVRTNNNGIAKIKSINNDFLLLDKIPQSVFIQNVTRASHNIIDLIEVGDYVNGDLVLFAGATTWDNDGNVLDKQVHINHNGYDWWLREEYIKSIVTKQQFESMQYEVK